MRFVLRESFLGNLIQKGKNSLPRAAPGISQSGEQAIPHNLDLLKTKLSSMHKDVIKAVRSRISGKSINQINQDEFLKKLGITNFISNVVGHSQKKGNDGIQEIVALINSILESK